MDYLALKLKILAFKYLYFLILLTQLYHIQNLISVCMLRKRVIMPYMIQKNYIQYSKTY